MSVQMEVAPRRRRDLLEQGQDFRIRSRFKFGEHPFLDGNGRTIMLVHAELAQRAQIRINWASTRKLDYLRALTQELEHPGQGHLDAYVLPFVSSSAATTGLAQHLAQTRGLDGKRDLELGENEVLGSVDDPHLQARYVSQQRQRAQSDPKYQA